MSRPRLKRSATWLPALVVLATVTAAGSRLVFLSVQQHAEEARAAAQASAARCANAIERQLEELVSHASTRTPSSSSRAATSDARAAVPDSRTAISDFKVFEWLDSGRIVAPGDVDPAVARAIVSEWMATTASGASAAGASASGASAAGASARSTSAPGARTAGLLGPMRDGSEWLIAARVPLAAPRGIVSPQDAAPDALTAGGWAVAFASLDRLFARAKLGRALGPGNDFALVQGDPDSDRTRVFVASSTEPLSRPALSQIRPPPGFAFASPGALSFEIRPRVGWYPTRTLATDIGLLALIGWLLTFIAHDLTQRTQRLRASLTTTRQQLHAANQRLLREIEQRERLQESVDRARFHDAFTGLPNRRYFMDQLDRTLREFRAHRGRRIGVFLVDIDRFQLINKTLGHTAGDELMVQAGRRFQRALASAPAVLARWGGDQFALLVPDLGSSDAAPALAGALQDALREPFEVRRHRLGITARIGMSCVESGPQRAEDVMREADVALSMAKRQEEHPCVAYSPAMGGDAASLVSLEADLHVALERRELKLLFQPIVDLHGRQAVGAEALLRWRHPIEGLLRPDRFLPIAEEAGLILPITRWTVRRVCRLASEWRRRLPPERDFYLSVNLSAAVLRDPELSDYVSGTLAETEIPPQALKFELNEGGLISNVAGARETLERLRRTGVELMLDDFGTGYSSLNYLQLFPFDYVKIDRPWIGEGQPAHGGTSLASAMVQLASSLGLTPIAEVVESQSVADALEEMGCRFGQGNFFCAPVEAEEALACLSAQTGGALAHGHLESATDDSPTLILPAGLISEP